MIVGDKALDALETAPKQVITETKRQMENDVFIQLMRENG